MHPASTKMEILWSLQHLMAYIFGSFKIIIIRIYRSFVLEHSRWEFYSVNSKTYLFLMTL